MFYQALHTALYAELDEELELKDFVPNLTRMFGEEVMQAVVGSIDGSVRFYGLTETDMSLTGVDKHLRLIESLKRLHTARAKVKY